MKVAMKIAAAPAIGCLAALGAVLLYESFVYMGINRTAAAIAVLAYTIGTACTVVVQSLEADGGIDDSP